MRKIGTKSTTHHTKDERINIERNETSVRPDHLVE